MLVFALRQPGRQRGVAIGTHLQGAYRLVEDALLLRSTSPGKQEQDEGKQYGRAMYHA